MRQGTLDLIRETKLIAIVRGLETEVLTNLAQALFDGGVRMMEITFAQDAPETWKETAEGIKKLNTAFAGKMLLGAGTVMSPEQLHMAFEAGASYIISPNLNAQIIAETRKLNLVSLPGAMTPSEIAAAFQAGADMVKVFPMDVLGASYIKSIRGPLPHIPLLAVGGVNDQNAGEFIRAGALGVGVGGSLVNKQWIKDGEFEKITALARQYMQAVQG